MRIVLIAYVIFSILLVGLVGYARIGRKNAPGARLMELETSALQAGGRGWAFHITPAAQEHGGWLKLEVRRKNETELAKDAGDGETRWIRADEADALIATGWIRAQRDSKGLALIQLIDLADFGDAPKQGRDHRFAGGIRVSAISSRLECPPHFLSGEIEAISIAEQSQWCGNELALIRIQCREAKQHLLYDVVAVSGRADS
jgi:hypothetical protein